MQSAHHCLVEADEMLPFRVGSNTMSMRVKSNHLDQRVDSGKTQDPRLCSVGGENACGKAKDRE